MAIVAEKNADILSNTVIKEFDESIIEYYNKNDIDRGYITAKIGTVLRKIFLFC